MNMISTVYCLSVESLLSSSLLLFIILFIISLFCIYLAIKFNKKNKTFITSIFISLFVAFIQIIITVFIIEKFLEKYQEDQWRSTKSMVQKMVNSELKENLSDIVYMMDFSNYRVPHNYIESRLEKKQDLTVDEVIYAANNLLKSMKLTDFADHKRYKKGDGIFDYQILIIEQFAKKMEVNLNNLEKILGIAQINISSNYYNEILECRNEYVKIINSARLYTQFLSASEVTGQIIDYNLNFELKYKDEMYTSLIKTINIIIRMLNSST